MAKKEEQLARTEDTSLSIPGMEDMITLERPTGADEGMLGSEGIAREDIIIPRIGLAQKTSPECDPTHDRYIEGVQFTHLFGSQSKRNYKNGPVYFAILRKDQPRYVEFIPLAEGGGVRDPNVPAGDPRTQFGDIDPATGRSRKPVATKFYDFIVLVLNDIDFNDPMQNVMALSLKSSAIKVAKQLNLFISQRGKKMLYKGLYELRSSSDTNKAGTFAVYKVKNAGWLKPDSKIEALSAEMFESWKDRDVKIDREAGDDSFDTESMDAQPASTTEM